MLPILECLIVAWAIVVVTYAWSSKVEPRFWAIFPRLVAGRALFVVALTVVQRSHARAAHRREA